MSPTAVEVEATALSGPTSSYPTPNNYKKKATPPITFPFNQRELSPPTVTTDHHFWPFPFSSSQPLCPNAQQKVFTTFIGDDTSGTHQRDGSEGTEPSIESPFFFFSSVLHSLGGGDTDLPRHHLLLSHGSSQTPRPLPLSSRRTGSFPP